MKIMVGFFLALAIGVVCRVAGVPLPAPLALTGVILLVAMTAGYEVVDHYASLRDVNQEGNP